MLALGLLALASACSGECKDADGDGYGPGCERGGDCDDTLRSRNVDCSEPAPDCDDDPFAAGCTCYRGEARECYPGGEGTSGVGQCRSGEQRCGGSGGWLECEGIVLPTFERCNGLDEDCDGRSDEGVRSPCGGCNDACRGGVWGGEGEAPFAADDQLEVNPYGELVLRGRPLATTTVFVPNTGEGTLSAVDPGSALERARYRTLADEPAQIAIDYAGGAWVLGERREGGSGLSQIAGDAAGCADRDGDGLETSTGPSDVLARGQDECVLLDVAFPGELGRLRGIAVSGHRAPDRETPQPVVWIGAPDERALIALDGASGEELERVETPRFRAYAAAFDPWGTLWAIDRDGWLAKIETALSPPRVEIREAELDCYVLESIAIDQAGVITLAGAECEGVARHDPARGTWTFVDMPGVLDARSVATTGEDSWVTHTSGTLTRIAHDPLALGETYGLGSDGFVPFDSSAISPDHAARLWIASGSGAGGGLLTRFDIATGRVTAQTPLGALPRPEGDLTGARRFTELEPQGQTSYVFTGCTQNEAGGSTTGTVWHALHVAGLAGDGSSVEIAVRRADTRAELEDEDFIALGALPADTSPFPLELDPSGAVEVRLVLRTDNYQGGPRIARVGLEWSCPGPQ